MKIKHIITTEGSLLTNFSNDKSFYFLKNDPLNHPLWQTFKTKSFSKTTKKLENFKIKFLQK